MARPPKPTATKELAGTARAHRRNKAEPKPARAMLPCPRDLAGPAAAHWRRLAPMLHGLGVLTLADEDALRRLCECLAQIASLEADLAAYGSPTVETKTEKGGYQVKARPEFGMISDLDRRLLGYFSRFGLTPADRSRIVATPDAPAEADPWDMLAAPPGTGAGRPATN